MAESAVTFLVEKLSSLLEKEANLLGGVRNEVAAARDELERIKAFLRTADASEDEDEEIKVWVKQVREVAYDAEDILDEFLYRFGAHQRPGFYGYLIKMARTIKTLKARRRIASELASIKTRVTSISDGHKRYGQILSRLEQGSSSSGSAGNNTWYELRSDARLLEEAQLVGIEQPKQKLKKCLFDESSSLRVVAVVGMGGLGKTTLVNQVYNDSEVNKHFQHHVWITVSQSFKLEELLKKIIEQLFDSIRQSQPRGAQSNNSHELKKIILNFLRERRFLVVLDDVWELQSWDALKYAFPRHNWGSRLLLTTRNTDVASTSTSEFRGDSYHLQPLSEEESWNLFCEKTFQGNPCPSHLETISGNILKRCEGLPLGIVAIGGVLSSKDINKIEEWDVVYRSLGAELEGNVKLQSVKRILSLSFIDLPYNLKSCFLYLSLFPEDSTFYSFDIVRLWIAEGFVQEMKGRTLEEVGESYFNELLNRSLVQLAREHPDKDWNRFKIHDLVREIVLAKAEDQNFAAIVSAKNPRLPEKVRRLSMCTPLENLQGDYNFSRLRSLLFFPLEDDSASRFSMSAFFNGGLRLLKVLNCQNFPNLERFPEGITKLYNLRFLSLEGKVTSVPPSIGKLRNLETLDLSDTQVEELPVEILKLGRLRHVIVYRSFFNDSRFDKFAGFKAPPGIETLTSLQTLTTIKASPGGVDLIRSLGMLKQLRILEIEELGAEHGAALCSSLQKLSRLRKLWMETREEDEVLDLHNISSPALQCLQGLYMHGCLEVLPNWLEVDPLESLQALPNLAVLRLQKAYGGEALCFKAGGFQMLKELAFFSLGKLRQVTIGKGALPRLEELHFEDCKLLEQVPSGLEFLTNLKKIWFIEMNDELVNKNRDDYVASIFIDGLRQLECDDFINKLQ
ncbi:hypothetical protein UlMin_036365 [Ulmus minor]